MLWEIARRTAYEAYKWPEHVSPWIEEALKEYEATYGKINYRGEYKLEV